MSGDKKMCKITMKIRCVFIKSLAFAALSASIEKNLTFFVGHFLFDYRK
jgi:hypothetical protein